MRVLGILPFLFFCALALSQSVTRPLRDAIIRAAIGTALWVVAGCELLSLFRAVSFWPLLFWWALPTLLLAWKCRTWRPERPALSRDWVLVTTLAATVVLLLLIFIGAAKTPPNNWDSLSAHLPRQIYWMQQRHVGLFPSNDARMLMMPPFAEYAGLHLMILSGGDKWLNLIQWLALALTALGASAIARDLGCNTRLQALAALLAVTVPPAALEASNTKNDVLTAFFLGALAFFGLQGYRARCFSAPFIGAACGLLVLSKGTGMMFGLPLAIWIGAAYVRIFGAKRALVWGTAVAFLTLSINAGQFLRLTTTFGSPLGPPQGKGAPRLANTDHTPRAFLSNLLRNSAMHLASGVETIDQRTTQAVIALHRATGRDVNDPRTTFHATGPFKVTANFQDEDRAKAPLHVLLGLGAFGVAIAAFFRRGDKWITAFLFLPFIGFGVFCFLVAWQEWHSRLHIPVLCLAAPVSVFLLRRLAVPFTVIAAGLALVCVITNEAKPLYDLKRARYRYKDQEMLLGLEEAKEAVREHRPRVLGLFTRAYHREYFLLSTLLAGENRPPIFVKLNNAYSQIVSPYPPPDLVITWYRTPGATNTDFHSKHLLLSQNGPVGVYLPVKPSASGRGQ